MRLKTFATSVASALLLPGLAHADTVQFLATDGNRLYRGDLDGNVEPFVTLTSPIQSLTRVPEGYSLSGAAAGDIIATATDPVGGAWAVYRLNDPMGTPTLTQIGSTSFGVGSLAFAPSGLFAANDSLNPMRVARLDSGNFATLQTYSLGVAVAGSGGIAYNPDNALFYVTDATNDRLLSWAPGGTAAVVGSTGIGFTNNGLEFLNGNLYGALRPQSPGSQLRVGTFNLVTGAFTGSTTVTGILGNGTGFVTIPAPNAGAAVLLGFGGLAAGRRRR